MRSWIQHSWLQSLVAACAACSIGVVACSDDDPETGIDPLQGEGGNAGSASSNAGAAGSPGAGGTARGGQGGSGGGAAAGSGAGGAAAGAAGAPAAAAGAAGAPGAAGTAGAAGSGPDVGEPDAGGGGTDGDGEPEPGEFAVAFEVLRNNCVPCHSNGGGLPQFAQADEDLAFAVTQANGNGGAPISERIVVRAVDLRTMPPSCGGGALGTGTCLTADEAADLEDWVEAGALR
jgi:hypothetical protein